MDTYMIYLLFLWTKERNKGIMTRPKEYDKWIWSCIYTHLHNDHYYNYYK